MSELDKVKDELSSTRVSSHGRFTKPGTLPRASYLLGIGGQQGQSGRIDYRAKKHKQTMLTLGFDPSGEFRRFGATAFLLGFEPG